uniref:Gse1 coiled-coil protein n=1 Tax=Tetraodon nigroviridis TaxID=99883 RepID=H3C8Z7_TETNG
SSGMNHESNKSPSLGMISTATRNTATVSPLSPLTNGNAAAQSANSGFAAALRKLAKQAEEPRGSTASRESSPVSSPATAHSSPNRTPKRSSLGPLLGQTRAHGVPSTPPVVTIAPTKTSGGLWRADRRQVEPSVQGLPRERGSSENSQPQRDKRSPPPPATHPLPYPFGLTQSSVMQDPRIQSLSLNPPCGASLSGQMHPEEYLRVLRPFRRLRRAPAVLCTPGPGYFHPAYLHHPLALPRMDESLCLSALRSQFYSVPGGGAFPPLHPSALHLHLPGGRYPPELSHTALAERFVWETSILSKYVLQMENDLRLLSGRAAGSEGNTRGQEQSRGEAEPRQTRYLSPSTHSHCVSPPPPDKVALIRQMNYCSGILLYPTVTHHRSKIPRLDTFLNSFPPDKSKDSEHPGFPAPKPLSLPHGLSSSRGTVPQLVPSLVSSHPAGALHGPAAPAAMSQRAGEASWLMWQRGQGQEREGPSELGLRSPGKVVELRRDGHSFVSQNRISSVHQNLGSKELYPSLGAPPPLISPKAPHHLAAPPTTLWNPASLIDTPADARRRPDPPTPPSRPPPGLTRAERPSFIWGEKLEDGARRRAEGLERFTSLRGPEAGSWTRTEQDGATPNLHPHLPINALHQKPCVPAEQRGKCRAASPPGPREQRTAPSVLIYDEVLQQQRRLLSKLDMEEKKRKEAKEEGYYYDLDESYDESDEEEVKAHLRRVMEQPPLKLDTSSEKVDFLRVCGLTTLAHRDHLLARKRWRRRRLMRERSPAPPPAHGKRKSPSPPAAPAPLTTPYTAEQMDSVPEVEEKKDFLLMFHLSHVSPQQRRDKERTEELLRAIRRKSVTLDTLRYNPLPPCSSPPAPPTVHFPYALLLFAGDAPSVSLLNHSNGRLYPDSPSPSPPYPHKPKHHPQNDPFKSSSDSRHPAHIPPPLVHRENGRSRASERFTSEAFVQHFHQAVLQSTQHLHQSKAGISGCTSEAEIKAESALPHRVSQLKNSTSGQQTHINGNHLHFPAAKMDTSGSPENTSEEDEDLSSPKKWQGIEAIFEAYQKYADEWSIERQVLHNQCKRLEAQNYSLTRTAEQLSVTMGELVSHRQKVKEERERLQAQLEHFRRCLTLPSIHWGRGQVNGHTL